jgi:hypothetical protein
MARRILRADHYTKSFKGGCSADGVELVLNQSLVIAHAGWMTRGIELMLNGNGRV